MEENNKEIQMRLVAVDEVRFMMSPDKLGDKPNPDNIQIGFFNHVETDIEKNILYLIFGIRYVIKEDVIMECVYKFSFDVLDLSQYVSHADDKSITIKYLIPHCLNVAVGTMRGILVVKTAGSVLSSLPLPMINVEELYNNLSANQGKQ